MAEGVDGVFLRGNLHVKEHKGENIACWELEFNWLWSQEGSISSLGVVGKEKGHGTKIEKKREGLEKGVGRVPGRRKKKNSRLLLIRCTEAL